MNNNIMQNYIKLILSLLLSLILFCSIIGGIMFAMFIGGLFGFVFIILALFSFAGCAYFIEKTTIYYHIIKKGGGLWK